MIAEYPNNLQLFCTHNNFAIDKSWSLFKSTHPVVWEMTFLIIHQNANEMTRRTIIGIIFVVAALLKLFSMWGIIHFDWLWQHPWPEYFGVAILLYIGTELIIFGFSHNNSQWLQRPIPLNEYGKRICCAVRFGGDEYIYHGETFKGARLDAFCGGIRLDLREAVFNEDEEIDIHTFMGGIVLVLPTTINVVVKSRSFIGGVGNEMPSNIIPHAPTLHIIASNFFGGVNIKN